ncbi:helix-turn-helix domain-containing protein [Pseudoduganella violacea]|uniref:Transcriptional regulator with XRE-family HTH domain n=1 Tax=Pseudoduganella violacea TaxID=1715466 RepID=A0A7W5BFF3_9BURK|nr:helix-turn-helix transcriptional regulator [Pseudoduganella violacea]MBB3122161.1 transcriptional regulator with XRE-family HTH domain [Pseudoduganella violacea]
MNYQELIEKALGGRTVNAVAKVWGVSQPTLSRYAKGERMPDWNTGLRIAKDAGIDPTEAFEIFAQEEQAHKVKNFKLQMGFVQIDLLLFIATGGLSCLFYIM